MRKNGCAATEPKLNPWQRRTPAAHAARRVGNVAWAALVLAPLMGVLWAAVASAWDAQAWTELTASTLLWPAWRMTLWTGLASTLLAYGLCAWLLSRTFALPLWARLVRALGPMLAVPHAAFAVGLVFLIAPSGWLLRAVSPWLTGLTQPPAWLSSQDPWGLGMVAVLALKELPFLLWGIASQLQRNDAGLRLARELRAAQTMGYARHTAFWHVVWPQLVPRMRWPLMAVLAYGLTVVDVAQIAGPSNPATLSVLAWQWLQDASPVTNAQGAQAGWLLAGTVATAALLWASSAALTRRRNCMLLGLRGKDAAKPLANAGTAAIALLLGVYGAVVLALLLSSVAGVWPFPQLLPQVWTRQGWLSVGGSLGTISVTLILAMASTALALLWAITWLECAPSAWDKAMRWPLALPLLLPSVLWVVGLHQVALRTGITASWGALVLTHTLAVLPYVVIALSPAYLGFDAHSAYISASLGASHWAFLTRVKWPMLRAAIASAAAVGVAVSVAQYLPTLYVGEGRFSTVTTEAVTLASGGQRSVVAAYAFLQWLIPVLGFALATWLGKPRRFAISI